MKKIIIPIGALLFSGLIKAQLSTTENYIYTKTYLNHPDPSDPTQILKTSETVQYFDGLGRPKQIINIKASPSNQDLVTTIPYDGFGRQVDSWLPAPMSSLNGGIQSGIEGAAQSYYSDNTPFTHKNLEASPLDRVLSQVQPGSEWQGHPIQFGYDTNLDGEVIKFTTTTIWSNNATNSNLFISNGSVSSTNGYYNANTLYKNTIIDEDGNKTIEFKNGEGQVILIRKVLSASENADTYYVYNEYNQLAFVITPKATQFLIDDTGIIEGDPFDSTTLADLCYQYKYDGRNRLVEKKLPGKDWEYLVYDKADRLVLTQDGNQRPDHKWSFNKYDKFGRIIYTGIAVDNGDRNTVQGWILFTYGINTEVSGSYTQSGMQIPYGNTAYPQNIESILTVNFYDTYPAGTPAFTPTIPNQSAVLTDNMSSEVNTKSLTLASYVKNIEDNNWTKNYSYYDTRGRVIATHSINHLGGYTQTESKLDFTGITQQTITRHKRLSADPERVIDENFTYDSQNRLLKHTHKIDNSPQAEILAQNEYDEISKLKTKKVGGVDPSSPLQTINYEYNILGWLTKINNPANLGGKLFGYEIRYNNPQNTSSTAKFNGNIAEIDWKKSDDGILRKYAYQYDGLNRLLSGIYSEPFASIPQNNGYNEILTYDLNGNISTLKRNASYFFDGVTQIDNLTYAYSGNQLTNLTDASMNYFGYPDSSGNLIHYDPNGNMSDHEDKGILEIGYNHLNLPNYVKFSDFVIRDDPFFGGITTVYKNTNYIYRADGVRLKKRHNYFSGRQQQDASIITEYLDGFQYSFDVFDHFSPLPIGLKFIPTSEGYYDFEQNKYIYQYKDQVGNIRLSYYKDDLGNAVIDRTNDYYPFGLEFGGSQSTSTVSSISYNYTYTFQGQERQQETGWNTFKWRNYDPAMGRFFNVDPLSEKYSYQSHYNFSENAVVAHRELEGLEKVSINKDTKNLIIAVRGYQGGGDPDRGKTQLKHYDKTSFLGALQNEFGNRKDTQVALFDASMGSRTPNDISESIRDFRKVSPDGALILAGHSMGADNIVNVSTSNKDIRINKTITIDISDPAGKANNKLSENVDSGVNYYQDNFFSIGGTKIEREESNKRTSIKNILVPNTSHTDIDNNETVKNQIIKDVKAILKP